MAERLSQRWPYIGRWELEALEAERDRYKEALREADRILAWWHGTFEPHTRRSWDYDKCEPCRPIREKVRAALAAQGSRKRSETLEAPNE